MPAARVPGGEQHHRRERSQDRRVPRTAYREPLHRAMGAIADKLPAGTRVPDRGELWDLRAL
jgi:hypothetical protein